MIDPHHLALIGLFAFKRNQTPVEAWKPTLQDATEMDIALRYLQPKIINGKKQYPFEQYCAEQGYIKFMENGQLCVLSAFDWGRANKIYSLLQWKREKDLQSIFEQYPEEKAAYEQKLEAIFLGIRGIFEKTRLSEAL